MRDDGTDVDSASRCLRSNRVGIGLLCERFTTGHPRADFHRFPPRNGQRCPLRRRQMLRQKNDLTNMARVVRHLPVDGLHDGVRFVADIDRAAEVGVGQRFERGEDRAPSRLPQCHQRGTRGGRRFEFGVTMAIWLLAVRVEEIRPTRAHVARQVLHDHGDRIRLRIERDLKLIVRHLGHGALTHRLEGAELGQ